MSRVSPKVGVSQKRRSILTFSLGVLSGWGLPWSLRAHASPDVPLIWDAIVVGSGLSGVSAALSALESGLRTVLLIEKAPVVGGHSFYSTGTIMVVPEANTVEQDRLWEDARRVGGDGANETLIRKIGRESESALTWLESMGVEFSEGVFQSLGGLSPRSRMAKASQAGYAYTKAIYEHALAKGLTVKLNTALTELTPAQTPAGEVWTVDVTEKGIPTTLYSYSVILATGGFTANAALLHQQRPDLPEGMRTTANPQGLYYDGATGDGILIAQKLGAALKDMSHIQLMPLWGGRVLDYVGGDIFLDHQGKRFVNEGASWATLEKALLALPEQTMWVVTDAQSTKGINLGMKLADGTVKKSDSIAEMARGMGLDRQVLEATLATYNAGAREGRDPQFGKETITQTIDKPPFYWGKERLYIHTTLGGIVINERTEVMSVQGRPLTGLYAVGETVGGVFGDNRLGGIAITAAIVLGREAGRQVAQRRQRIARP